MTSRPTMTQARPPCPICRKPATARYRPFCSARCADVDLGRWLGEQYVVPGETPPDGFDTHDPTAEEER